MSMLPKRSHHDTAEMSSSWYCNCCGWPVVVACCNDDMSRLEPYAASDWWAYCANKGCVHHGGEGYFQNDPDFVARIA